MLLQGVNVVLQALNSKLLPLKLLAQFGILPSQIIFGELNVMDRSSLILDYEL